MRESRRPAFHAYTAHAAGKIQPGYFCPTPRNGLIGSEDCCCLLSLLSEVGNEASPANPNDLADFVRRLAGVVIEHSSVPQFQDIGSRPSSVLPSRLCRCAACAQACF